jgi:glyoxylase I family protein
MTDHRRLISELKFQLTGIHHAAIICSNYERSKHFYTEILGLPIIAENYRQERSSYKLDLAVGEHSQVELFSFPDPPLRVTRPEAAGLRHLAFSVVDIESQIELLRLKGVEIESLRVDEYTGKKFAFFSDPDGLPLELYEN